MKKISILGSTGSIGRQSLLVCKDLDIHVAALTAKSNVGLLLKQAAEFKPDFVAIQDESLYGELKRGLFGQNVRVAAGKEAILEAAGLKSADFVINALVGIAGLRPTLAAIKAKKTLALANKESLVTGGALVTSAARSGGVDIIPVDSEHSAIFQCMRGGLRQEVRGVILTASGGPFFGKKAKELQDVTAEAALRHPNWTMGPKITVDCSTMMNKGLELIEAMWLFDLAPEEIEIVVHRQSAVHSAVEFADGVIIAQLGVPDMRTAIQYAITYPRRMPRKDSRLSITQLGSLTFEKPDFETFGCLSACVEAAKLGGLAPAAVNGANEQAVELFLQGKIRFLQIGEMVSLALENLRQKEVFTLEDVEDADQSARECVLACYKKLN